MRLGQNLKESPVYQKKNNENLTGMNRPYSNNDRRQDLQENTALSTKGKQSIGRPRK